MRMLLKVVLDARPVRRNLIDVTHGSLQLTQPKATEGVLARLTKSNGGRYGRDELKVVRHAG
jgi:hypothetical protein